jgi:hypothetical protein
MKWGMGSGSGDAVGWGKKVEGLIKFLKLIETFAESDEDPGIVIDLDVIVRRFNPHPHELSQALDNNLVSEYATQNT